jgi:hypothetical protein
LVLFGVEDAGVLAATFDEGMDNLGLRLLGQGK